MRFPDLQLIVLLACCAGAGAVSGPSDEPLKDYTNVDLGLHFDEPRTDPKTGFVVGGKNSTALIRTLTEINGRKIEDLEWDMRPGKFFRLLKEEAPGEWKLWQNKEPKDRERSDLSWEGFLGPKEKLLEVMASDNRYVVDELGMSHRELGRHLRIVTAIGFRAHDGGRRESEFTYHGSRFHIRLFVTMGGQLSPFLDGSGGSSEVDLHNLTTGKTLKYADLVPIMIERYGFYEGKGTRYRVEPRDIVDVFDFLETNEATGIERLAAWAPWAVLVAIVLALRLWMKKHAPAQPRAE